MFSGGRGGGLRAETLKAEIVSEARGTTPRSRSGSGRGANRSKAVSRARSDRTGPIAGPGLAAAWFFHLNRGGGVDLLRFVIP